MACNVNPHDAAASSEIDELVLGVDIGSTTVKTVAIDSKTRRILWSSYQRHETRQAATVETQLAAVERSFAHVPKSRIRVFATGSGAAPLIEPLGAKIRSTAACARARTSLGCSAGPSNASST
jgi:activator of 2-hydroxyglutaryl-CoA dehydratase